MRAAKRAKTQPNITVVADFEVAQIFQSKQAEDGELIDWQERFISNPTYTDMDFRRWVALECSKTEYEDIEEAILDIGEQLGKCYVSCSRVRVLRTTRDGLAAPQIIPSSNDFMSGYVAFQTAANTYSVRLDSFARILVVREVRASAAYNVLVTPPPTIVDLAAPIGMQHGYAPIVDDAKRRARLESEARRLCIPLGFWNSAPEPLRPEDGDPIFTVPPEIIAVFVEYVTHVLAGGNLEDAQHLLRCIATIVRGEQLRMFIYLMTRATQIGKTTLKNLLYALGVTTATIENADVLTGEFNAHVKQMLVVAEELTRDPKKIPKIMAALRNIATGYTVWVYRKGLDGVEELVVANVLVATNGQESEDGAAPAVPVSFGDERMLLFNTIATTNPELFTRLYNLLKDKLQVRALFVYLSGLHNGTVYSDAIVAQDPTKFNPVARPADMRARLSTYAYAAAAPLMRLIANLYTAGAFEPVSPNIVVDGLIRHDALVTYLLAGGVKTAQFAQKLIVNAITDGLLRRVSSDTYDFGAQCPRMFALAVDVGAAINVEPIRQILRMTPAQRAAAGLRVAEGSISRTNLADALLLCGAVETERDARRMIRAAERSGMLLPAPFVAFNTLMH